MSDLAEYQRLINEQTQLNNSWSAEQAQKQMDFQERMSSTAHQREVADLKAAGLNPVLSANSGASTPNGSMGTGTDANITAIADIAMNLANAENAKAIAAMRSSGLGSNGYYGKSTWAKMLEDIIEGYTGTSAQQGLNQLGSWINRSGIVGQVANAAKNVITKVSGLLSGTDNNTTTSSTESAWSKFGRNLNRVLNWFK